MSMRILLVAAGALLLAGCAMMGTTMTNEPAEIQNLKLNTHISEIPVLVKQNGYYVREGDNLQVYGVPVKNIYYKFYEDRLYEVSIIYEGMHAHQGILSGLKNEHGLSFQEKITGLQAMVDTLSVNGEHSPPRQEAETYGWIGKETSITLKYNSGEGILIYQYLPALQRMQR